MDSARRILVSLSVFALALLLFATLLRPDGYGLLDLAAGKKPPANPPLPVEGVALPQQAPLSASEVPLLTQLDQEYALLAERTIPSVVSINTVRSGSVPRLYLSPYGLRQRNETVQQPGLGSGVIVSAEGHVLTNHHVIEGVDGIQITTHDGTAHRASIVGSDPVLDVAVLKIDTGEDPEAVFPALPFGNSDRARVGQSILAVGNPFGLSSTVTRGIISAKERSLSDGAPDLLQTDAVINPGNSGGPLVNAQGEIIGISLAIYKGQQGLEVWQGVGLAIPSNSARAAFETIMTRGRPLFGYLGVTVGREVVSGGIAITGIAEDSPAEKAQLALGDRILEYRGNRVTVAEDFVRQVLSSPVGQPVELVIQRGVETLTVTATLGERPTVTPSLERETPEAAVTSIERALGITCRDLTNTEIVRAGTYPNSPGVLVLETDKGSPLAGSLSRGDLIQQVNGIPTGDVSALSEALAILPEGEQAVLFAIAKGQPRAIRWTPRNGEREEGKGGKGEEGNR